MRRGFYWPCSKTLEENDPGELNFENGRWEKVTWLKLIKLLRGKTKEFNADYWQRKTLQSLEITADEVIYIGHKLMNMAKSWVN